MTIPEANRLIRQFYSKANPTEDELFLATEALSFLIEETKDPDAMVTLGSIYYEHKDFDLALKYYEMAAEYDNIYALSNLGYVWYYGRTGERNYEKAFYYFDRAREMGDIIAAFKVADMYKNGYYVEKSEGKYKEIIEELYTDLPEDFDVNYPAPEISIRLAGIREKEGRVDEALTLYSFSRSIMGQRIMYHPFFGDLTIMKQLIADIYRLTEFDPETFSLYDLYHVLRQPASVSFSFEERQFQVDAVEENGDMSIRFDGHWYPAIDEFFQKATIDQELLTTLVLELYDFEVLT